MLHGILFVYLIVLQIELTWDSNLETVAQNFVNAATSGGHNSARTTQYADLGGSGYVGENWYSGSPSDAAVKWATFVWPVSWGGNGVCILNVYFDRRCVVCRLLGITELLGNL